MINQTNSGWTPELKERVKVLWATQSALQISVALNCEGYTFTRNSIIGVLHRANLTSAHKTEEHPASRTATKRAPRNSANQVRRPKITVEEIKLRCVDIVCATPFEDVTGCRYTTSDGAPFLFCDGPQQPGSSFCPNHHALCWVKPIATAPKVRKYFGTDFAA